MQLVRFIAVTDGTGCHRKQRCLVEVQVLYILRHQRQSTRTHLCVYRQHKRFHKMTADDSVLYYLSNALAALVRL